MLSFVQAAAAVCYLHIQILEYELKHIVDGWHISFMVIYIFH